MVRAFYVVVGFSVLLVSCTQRVICPAYQSAYIYDKDELRKKFSYFNEDATPKVLTASKTKYLIAEPESYRKKVRNLQTVPMKSVYPVVPDSLKQGASKEEDFGLAERNVNDSTAVIRIDTLSSSAEDSVYVISKEREITILKYDNMKRKYFVDTVGYNTEQNNYMWYLRDVLVLPDARLAQEQSGDKDKSSSEQKRKKKEKKGFLKNLFKKKKKSGIQQDSTLQIAPVTTDEDYGYDDFQGKTKDSTAVEPQSQQPSASKPKKGIFSFLKKEKAVKKKPVASPAKKEDVKDDGF